MKDMEIKSINFADLPIDRKEIDISLDYYNSGYNSHLEMLIADFLSELASFNSYKFGYKHIINGRIEEANVICLENIILNPQSIIMNCFKESTSFIVLVATVGDEVDNWIERKKGNNDIIESFVADALGSVIVEAIVKYALLYLEKEMGKENLKISNSYSPGYCGWDIIEQQKIFSLLPDRFCGITLTKSSLMLPIKSVSALVGVGEKIKRKEYGCKICKKKDCYKRRIKEMINV